MTRKDKIYFLTMKGEKIEWHLRPTDQRLMIDSIKVDGTTKTFKLTPADQVAAGQWIDLLYHEWMLDEE